MAGGSFPLATLSLAFLCSCLTFHNANADLIGDLCSTVPNHSFCNQALRSDPRSAKADIRGLGQIALDKALASAKTTLKLAQALGNGQKPSTCAEVCSDAIDDLNECQGLLRGNDKGSLNIKASAAMTDLDTCDDDYGAKEPINLKNASQTTKGYISIILAVSNRL
ncbi:pectinesterase inhibitor [Olea europaea var. sylvestris]|uniref:Pectinesterase inhibitor-like n=1 Tax=Olea europaea subsp. europaea TaxID=158383 RepID=A0A8S0PVU1_OLEEU|nr:pectinesterase inhibitor [Olea europaea var. sylvestris]CAA2956555.1 pectinesterase inhibitor-like [Olea europaea subsp. europaea]